jgi:rubrerythrin
MKADKLKQALAARRAFEAYEHAAALAQNFIDAGPVSLGTTVMIELSASHGYRQGSFECAECGYIGAASDWKFCPSCGKEIMRFERIKEPVLINYGSNR